MASVLSTSSYRSVHPHTKWPTNGQYTNELLKLKLKLNEDLWTQALNPDVHIYLVELLYNN